MDPNRTPDFKTRMAQIDAETAAYAAKLQARIAGLSPEAALAVLEAEGARQEAEDRARNVACGFPNGEVPRDSSGALDTEAIHAHFMTRAFEKQPWEANPEGLSGRLVRGYRHWRHKR